MDVPVHDLRSLVLSVLIAGVAIQIGDTLYALFNRRLFVPRRPRRPLTFELPVLLAAVFLLLAVPLAIANILGARGAAATPLRKVEIQAAANVIAVLILLPTLVATRKNRLTDFGIDLQGARQEARYGGLGFLASIPLVIAVLVIMSPWRTQETEHPFLKLIQPASSDRAIIEVVLAAVVSAPLMEELVFRVVLQGMLARLIPPATAIIATAVAFVAVHPILDQPALLPLAIILGIVYHARRSYVAVVILHALFNATFLILSLLSRG